MEPRNPADRRRTRIMLWAVAILFAMNFYMFVAARTAPATIEIVTQPVATATAPTAPVTAPRCFVTTRVQVSPDEANALIEARRVLRIERERLRSKTARFSRPDLRISVTPSAG